MMAGILTCTIIMTLTEWKRYRVHEGVKSVNYWRVKKEYDQRNTRKGRLLIGYELYTESERSRLEIPKKYLESVECKDTYFMFGCRFQSGVGRYKG